MTGGLTGDIDPLLTTTAVDPLKIEPSIASKADIDRNMEVLKKFSEDRDEGSMVSIPKDLETELDLGTITGMVFSILKVYLQGVSY